MFNAPIMGERNDGKINEDVYVSYQINLEDHSLIRMWVGTRRSGPVLQYDADGICKWDGYANRDFPGGAWTICYSHGNYGRNYACGGTWSSHTINLDGGVSQTKEERYQLIMAGNTAFPVSDDCGIQGDVAVTEIIPSDGWAIWFATADEAIQKRLPPSAIAQAKLPDRCKVHLAEEDLDTLREVVSAYSI